MISVFISYAHADEKLKDRFLVHLGALKRERLIGVWHDRMLRPGDHLDRAIEAELAAAKLVILLVSPDFINSDYCTEKEMQRAFARAKRGQCKVVAVILKPSRWREIPIDDEGGRLGDFVALPKDGKPVTRNREKALDSVVASIRRLIEDQSAPGPVALPPKRDDTSPAVDVMHPPTHKSFERDVWLADAIWRAFLGTWDLPVHGEREPEGQSENQRFYDLVTKEFRQAAFDDRLPTWAKRSNSDLWEFVPKEFWKDHRISYLNVIREDPTKLSVEKEGSVRPSKEWREFMTSKRAVDAQWPAAHRPSGDGRRRAGVLRVPSPRKRPSSPSADELTCPIRKTRAKPLNKIGDADGFECANDGRFRVSGTVLAAPAQREASRQRWEDALRRARARQPEEWAPTLMTYDFD
jgi:TIR domain